MKKSLQLLLCGLASVSAAGGNAAHDSNALGSEFNTANEHPDDHWTYSDNGANWPSKSEKSVAGNKCGLSKTVPNSPIDLKYSWPKKSNILDRFSKVYTDQTDKIKVYWNGHTSTVKLDKEGMNIQSFYSHIADTTYNTIQRFNGVQFHFHAGSEHTVEGVRQDLEMHTVHLPQDGQQTLQQYKGFAAAAMGIMFSVEKPSRTFEAWEVKIIDDFFDSFQWTDSATEPVVPKVPYGQLMMFVDMQNRWTYRGSVTTPPCATAVYWNVLTTIYPIKQKHLDQFKLQLKKSPKKDPTMPKTGNWRIIQPYVGGDTGHQAQIIKTMGGGNVGMLVAVIILALIVFALLVVVMKLRAQLKAGGQSTEMGALKVQPVTNDSQNYNSVVEAK